VKIVLILFLTETPQTSEVIINGYYGYNVCTTKTLKKAKRHSKGMFIYYSSES